MARDILFPQRCIICEKRRHMCIEPPISSAYLLQTSNKHSQLIQIQPSMVVLLRRRRLHKLPIRRTILLAKPVTSRHPLTKFIYHGVLAIIQYPRSRAEVAHTHDARKNSTRRKPDTLQTPCQSLNSHTTDPHVLMPVLQTVPHSPTAATASE